MPDPTMHASDQLVNIEKAMDPILLTNQPDTKAALLPILRDDSQISEGIGKKHLPAVPQPEIPADPTPETPAEPAIPPEPEPPADPIPGPEDIPPDASPRKPRRLPLILVGLAAALILAAGLCGWMHFRSYKDAVRLATLSEFPMARETLFLDSLTPLHDREFADYLEGGERMISGDYDGARTLLEPLAEEGYQNCAELLREIDYRESCDALDRGDLALAIQRLEPLAAIFYRDSRNLYCEARIRYGLEQLDDMDDINAVSSAFLYLAQVAEDGYPSAQELLEGAQATTYDYAVSLYEIGDLSGAAAYFELLGSYSRSVDYLTLCRTYDYTTTVEELWALRGFVNADEILLTQYYLCEFLIGSWRTSNDYYYYNMEATTGQYAYTCTYNLPWQYSGDFEIVDGVYRVFHNGGDTSLNEFRITIDSWSQITIYCYKNGSTYALYRK